MKYYIKTYGCQMNERDSGSVSGLLAKQGHVPVETEAEAELVLVNTCSVRAKAEDKALGKLGLLTSEKRRRPGQLVGAMGCMVQRLGHDIFRKVPHLDFAVGTRGFSSIPAILKQVGEGEAHVLETGEEEKNVEDLSEHVESGPSAFVNILFGCNRGCSYCIVPTVRGREWSRSAEDILEEIESLSRQGIREVTLLGQSVMSYGRANDVWPAEYKSLRVFDEPLPRLLEAVSDVDGIERVRFTSGHPSGCTLELASAMAGLGPVCEHLHIPLQSGSDRILKMMRRGYTVEDYRSAVKRLRAHMPEIAVTTDIIVGFPTESNEEFETTRSFMEEMRFDNAFIFKYSPRPGTPAAEWEDDVSDEEKLRRNKVLLEDQDTRGLSINRDLVGCGLQVLADGPSLRNPEKWSGRSAANKIVIFDPVPSVSVGDLVIVKIEKAMAQTLYGTLAAVVPAGSGI